MEIRSPTIVLFVCTGNTCRSPMAEHLLRHLGRSFDGLRVGSAGLFANPGSPASAQSVEVMKEKGLDLSGHRSRLLDSELISTADLLIPLTQAHRDLILEAAPDAGARTRTLHSFGAAQQSRDVADPYGGSLQSYRRTRDEIESALSDVLLALIGPNTTP